MENSPPHSTNTKGGRRKRNPSETGSRAAFAPAIGPGSPGFDCLTTHDLARYIDGWHLTCEINQHSPRTIERRRGITEKLLWFLNKKQLATCGVTDLRLFLASQANGHNEPNGRWDNPFMRKPVRPRTVHTVHAHLRTLFRWIVSEGGLQVSPMERIPVTTARADQIQPFTPQQVNALLVAARRTQRDGRDEALLLVLLDTGIRASEVCNLRVSDLDVQNRRLVVLGKGNKHRTVPFGSATARALWQYLRDEPHDPGDPLFFSERGQFLTRSGLLQLFERLGERAKISATRCSPHTMRHTCAVEYLRAGGNVFALKELLGHTTLHMTNRYVALAQADIEAQHRKFSPADRLKGGAR